MGASRGSDLGRDIDSIVNPAMCLIVCMHERDYIIVIILSMMKLLNPKS